MNRRNELLTVRGLRVEFGGVRAADGVDVSLYEGELAAIIGPNGSGKTTFINLCTGYVKPSAGTVSLRGLDITREAPRAITRRGVARTFQLPQLFTEHTVHENLLLGIAARSGFWRFAPLSGAGAGAQADELLAVFGLARHRDTDILALPEGVRKLVDIAVAMALEPSLILMDEPTSGVSSIEKFAIMDTLVPVLRQRGVSALVVEHDMELVERYMDRVIVWNAGKVVADGPPAQVLKDPAVIRDVIGEA